MTLHRVVEGTGPRVVLVHGFTQTHRSWDALVGRLASSYEVVRVDLPGHGGSAGVDAAFDETAALVGAAGGEAVYVAYSLGGRLALRLALDRPDLVQALVAVGASPGLEDPREREERVAADARLAGEIERDGVEAFLERWLAQPLFAGLPTGSAGLEHRLGNPAGGLARALRRLGTGTQEPLWNRLPDLRPRALFVAGERDAKFTAIARRMAAAAPGGEVSTVAGAGHAAHLERPDAFGGLVERFLTRRVPA